MPLTSNNYEGRSHISHLHPDIASENIPGIEIQNAVNNISSNSESHQSSSTIEEQISTNQEHVSLPTADTGQTQNSVDTENMTGTSSTHPMQTRLRSGIIKANPKYACLVEYKIPVEPKSIKSALAHQGWYQAMQEEMDALYQNQTWEVVPRDNHMNVIGCKWVFKTKLAPDGSLDRLKARLVAKGFHQEEGLDFTETFSPCLSPSKISLWTSTSSSSLV